MGGLRLPIENTEKTKKKKKNNKNHVVCKPDFKLPVALSAPRSACLADFQPPGASNSLPGLKSEKNLKTNGEFLEKVVSKALST
jgi:hypothetical protein